jgi:hypothetical protein
MLTTVRRSAVTMGIAAAATTLIASSASADTPTCSDTLGITVHGQHIVGDYVAGIGHETLGWPPDGAVIAEAVSGVGVAVPGGPGPGFHFPNGFAPGASFCNDSNSPGTHL